LQSTPYSTSQRATWSARPAGQRGVGIPLIVMGLAAHSMRKRPASGCAASHARTSSRATSLGAESTRGPIVPGPFSGRTSKVTSRERASSPDAASPEIDDDGDGGVDFGVGVDDGGVDDAGDAEASIGAVTGLPDMHPVLMMMAVARTDRRTWGRTSVLTLDRERISITNGCDQPHRHEAS
jgi:hypothetical protein